MRRTFSGRDTELRRQAALTVDVKAFVEAHLRDLAVAGRLNELARSRDALANRYRAQGNDAAVYCLASAPDFSLAEAPDAAKEVESRATQLAGGPERFRTLSDDQREVLTTQAAEELIRQQRGG